MLRKNSSKILTLSLLYLLTLSLRTVGLKNASLQEDEVLWRSRSERIVQNIERKNYKNLFSHLKHPGIPPACIMGAGQTLLGKIQNVLDISSHSKFYCDSFCQARFANALASSSIVPLVYLTTFPLFGGPGAALSAIMLASDPQHIANSKIAHLDAFYAVLVLIVVSLYYLAVKYNSTKYKLSAGLAWGLCIATKPTSGAIILAFLLYKILRNLAISKTNDRAERTVISWSDIWAVVIAHAFLGSIYTRFWQHDTPALGRLRIPNWLADEVYSEGTFLNTHLYFSQILFSILAAVLIALLVYQKKFSRRFIHHLIMLTAITMALAFATFIAPQVVENCIRYWTFATSLVHEAHKELGSYRSARYGYFELFFRVLPPPIIFGLLVSFAYLFKSFFTKPKNQQLFEYLILLALVVICWVMLLSFSKKQIYRYVLPVVPLIYILASAGLLLAYRYLVQALKNFEGHEKHLGKICSASLLGYFAFVYYANVPNFYLYFNSLSGGLLAAQEKMLKFPISGEREILSVLQTEAEREEKTKLIMVVGDSIDLLKRNYQIYFDDRKVRLDFTPNFSPFSYHYVVIFAAQSSLIEEVFKKYSSRTILQPFYSYKIKGVTLSKIYKVPNLNLAEPLGIDLSYLKSQTGNRKQLGGKGTTKISKLVLAAEPSKHPSGLLIDSSRFSFDPGTYNLRIKFEVPTQEISPENLPLKILRLNFGHCERNVELTELRQSKKREINLSCHFKNEAREKFSIYWHGNFPITLFKVYLESTDLT